MTSVYKRIETRAFNMIPDELFQNISKKLNLYVKAQIDRKVYNFSSGQSSKRPIMSSEIIQPSVIIRSKVEKEVNFIKEEFKGEIKSIKYTEESVQYVVKDNDGSLNRKVLKASKNDLDYVSILNSASSSIWTSKKSPNLEDSSNSKFSFLNF